MSATPEEVPAPLNILRCWTCGTIMGYTTQQNLYQTILWCSPECREVPVGQRNENNPRDELMVELQANGIPISRLAASFGISRQAVSQVLNRRLGRKPTPRTIWVPPVTVKRTLTKPRRGRVK